MATHSDDYRKLMALQRVIEQGYVDLDLADQE